MDMLSPVLLRYQLETPERARVYGFHNKPDELTADQISKGFLTDEATLPKAAPGPRQVAVLYINPKTKALWYEYEPRAATTEELLADFLVKQDALIAKQDLIIAAIQKLQPIQPK